MSLRKPASTLALLRLISCLGHQWAKIVSPIVMFLDWGVLASRMCAVRIVALGLISRLLSLCYPLLTSVIAPKSTASSDLILLQPILDEFPARCFVPIFLELHRCNTIHLASFLLSLSLLHRTEDPTSRNSLVFFRSSAPFGAGQRSDCRCCWSTQPHWSLSCDSADSDATAGPTI